MIHSWCPGYETAETVEDKLRRIIRLIERDKEKEEKDKLER